MNEHPRQPPIPVWPQWDTTLRKALNLLDPPGSGRVISQPLPRGIRADLENRLRYLVLKTAPCDPVELDQQATLFYGSFPQLMNRGDLDAELMVRRTVKILGRFPDWIIEQLFIPTEQTARLRNTEYATPPDKFFEIATELLRPVDREIHDIRRLLEAPVSGTEEAGRLQEEGRAYRSSVVEKYWNGSLRKEFQRDESAKTAPKPNETTAETLARTSGLPISEVLDKLSEVPDKPPPPAA